MSVVQGVKRKLFPVNFHKNQQPTKNLTDTIISKQSKPNNDFDNSLLIVPGKLLLSKVI